MASPAVVRNGPRAATRARRWGGRYRTDPRVPTRPRVDLVGALDLPLLLVVGLRLGCIKHARLSAHVIAADGARLIGWVGNGIDPAMGRCDDVFALLQARLSVPCRGRLPFAEPPDRQALAMHLGVADSAAQASIERAPVPGASRRDFWQGRATGAMLNYPVQEMADEAPPCAATCCFPCC